METARSEAELAVPLAKARCRMHLFRQAGAGTVFALTEFKIGPEPDGQERSTERPVQSAAAAGLSVVPPESLLMALFDIAAVVHFQRKVICIVSDFTVRRYHDGLLALHQQIQSNGPFVTSSERILCETRPPRLAGPFVASSARAVTPSLGKAL